MDLKISQNSPALVVQISGRLDTITAASFSKQCEEIASQGESNVILDLEQLDYISSAGLREILSLAKKLTAAKANLSLCSLQPLVEEVFQMAGFSLHLKIHSSLEEAIAATQ